MSTKKHSSIKSKNKMRDFANEDTKRVLVESEAKGSSPTALVKLLNEQDKSRRAIRGKKIKAHYSGQPPFKPHDLKKTGRTWHANLRFALGMG